MNESNQIARPPVVVVGGGYDRTDQSAIGSG
jgi:hypothetical protein